MKLSALVEQQLGRSDDPWRQAQIIAREAAALGFDWTHLAAILAKVAEELDEVRDAHAHLQASLGPAERAERQAALALECGDVLFAALNVCRLAGVQPEGALLAANAKFLARFAHMEQAGLPAAGSPASLAEWQRLWQEAKLAEGSEGSPVRDARSARKPI